MKPSTTQAHVSTRRNRAKSEGSINRWGGVGPAVTADSGADTWVRPSWMRNLENRYQRLHKKIAAIPVSKLPPSYRLNPLTRRFLNLAVARAGKRLGSEYSTNTRTAGASFTSAASSKGDDSGRFSGTLPHTVSHCHRDSLRTETLVSLEEIPNDHHHQHHHPHPHDLDSFDSENDSHPVTTNKNEEPPSPGSNGDRENGRSACCFCCPRCRQTCPNRRSVDAQRCHPDLTTTTTTRFSSPSASGTAGSRHPYRHLPARTNGELTCTKPLRDSRRTSGEPSARDEIKCSEDRDLVPPAATTTARTTTTTGPGVLRVCVRPGEPSTSTAVAAKSTDSSTSSRRRSRSNSNGSSSIEHQCQCQQQQQQHHHHCSCTHIASDGGDGGGDGGLSCRNGHRVISMVAREDYRESLAALKQRGGSNCGGGGGGGGNREGRGGEGGGVKRLEGGSSGGGGGGVTRKTNEDMGDSSTRKLHPAGKGRKVRSTNRSPTNNNKNNNNSSSINNNNNYYYNYHHKHQANTKLLLSTNGNELPVLATFKAGGVVGVVSGVGGVGGNNGGGGVGGVGGSVGSEEEGGEKSDRNSLALLPQMSVEARHAISETLKEMGTTDSFDLEEETGCNGQLTGPHHQQDGSQGDDPVFQDVRDDDDDDDAKSITSLPSIADPLPSLPLQRRSWHPTTSDDYHLTTHHHHHPHHHSHHPLHHHQQHQNYQSRENSLTASQKTTTRQKSFRSSRQPDTGSSVHKGSSTKSPRRSNKRPPSLRTGVNNNNNNNNNSNVRMGAGARSDRTQEMTLWDEDQADMDGGDQVGGRMDFDLLSIPSAGNAGSNRSSPDTCRQPVQRMHLPAITSRTEPNLKKSPRKEGNIRHINYRIRGVGSYRVPRENTFEITAPDFDIRYREVITCQKGDRETPPPEVFEKSVGKVREWLNKYYSYSPSS